MAGTRLEIKLLSRVSRTSFPTEMRLILVCGWKGAMLAATHLRASRTFTSAGIRLLGTVTVTVIPVLAKALSMSELTSKILMLSIMVWVLRKLATWVGEGRFPKVP